MILFVVLLQALSCLLNPPAPFMTEWGHSSGKWLADEPWVELQTLSGRDLWLGYENGGWETTGDEYGRYKLTGNDYEVWLFYSPTRQEYDLLPFANTTLFADAKNNHYGLHPCGGWAVEESIVDRIIGDREGG
ncbi:MAG TPA: hypothetical protein VIH42_05620 [Thermoguttaceae bacterium]